MDGIPRYQEIDLARGIAILMMIVYHTVYDLGFLGISAVAATTGFWKYFAFLTAGLFLLIVGISLTVSRSRASHLVSGARLAGRFVRRGAGLVLLGLLATAATWVYLRGEGFIIFGILHLIGVSVMLSPLFFRFGKYNLVAGSLFILTGWLISTIPGPAWLIPLGIHPPSFWSVDYEPVFPWTGLVLWGMALGEYLYPGGRPRFPVAPSPGIVATFLSFAGRHSLVVYLLHQPFLFLLLGALFGIPLL